MDNTNLFEQLHNKNKKSIKSTSKHNDIPDMISLITDMFDATTAKLYKEMEQRKHKKEHKTNKQGSAVTITATRVEATSFDITLKAGTHLLVFRYNVPKEIPANLITDAVEVTANGIKEFIQSSDSAVCWKLMNIPGKEHVTLRMWFSGAGFFAPADEAVVQNYLAYKNLPVTDGSCFSDFDAYGNDGSPTIEVQNVQQALAIIDEANSMVNYLRALPNINWNVEINNI